jgi:hypothetical protein
LTHHHTVGQCPDSLSPCTPGKCLSLTP